MGVEVFLNLPHRSRLASYWRYRMYVLYSLLEWRRCAGRLLN